MNKDSFYKIQADNGSRTRLLGLGSRCTTDVLYLRLSHSHNFTLIFPQVNHRKVFKRLHGKVFG